MESRKEYLERIQNYACIDVHEKCMEHCLDGDSEEKGSKWDTHNCIRGLWKLECREASKMYNGEIKKARERDVPIPLAIRRERGFYKSISRGS